MHARRLSGQNRLFTWRYVVLVLGVLISSLGILYGCSSDPYAKLKLSANANTVALRMEIDATGNVDVNSKHTGHVIFTVSGAPDVISKGVNVTSLDTSVVRIEKKEVKGNRTRVTIVAVGGGRTQLRALTSGGGKDLFVDVNVDIPARAMEIKDGVQFGINKGGTLKFDTEHFTLFASEVARDTMYATTINNIKYSLEGSPSGANLSETGVLTLSENSSVLTGSKIRVSAKLDTGFVLDPIDVYVFEPFDPIKFMGITATSDIDDQPLVEFVRNGEKDQDKVDAKIEFTKQTVQWRHESLSLNANSAMYGYFIENHDPHLVHVRDEKNTSFSLFANSTGQSYVDVVLFPIASDGTKFNRSIDKSLQLRQPIKVEIRHVFKEKVKVEDKDVPHLQISHDVPDADNPGIAVRTVLGTDELVVLYPFGEKVTEAERKRFNVTLADKITVNNTDQVPTNSYVIFEWGDNPPENKNIWDVFDITYCTRVSHVHSSDPIMTQTMYTRTGVPYNALFSLTLKDPAFIDKVLNIKVRSLAKKTNGEPLGSVNIKIYGAQSIGSIEVFSQLDGISGGTRDVSLPKLYPVRGASAPYVFYLRTDRNSNASRFGFEDYDDDLFSFETENVSETVTKVTMRLKETDASKYQLGKDYNLRIGYVNGYAIPITIEVLDRLNSFTMRDIAVQEVSGEQVYNNGELIYDEQNTKITAYVRINATYGIVLIPDIKRAGVRFEVDGIEMFGDNHFKLTEEKTYTATLSLFALNNQVFPPSSSLTYTLNIIVVNPITSASLSKGFISVLSEQTLGMYDIAASKETVSMQMTFASGTTSKNTPVFSFKLDNSEGDTTIKNTYVAVNKKDGPNFEIQGLRGNTHEVVVYFFVKQVFDDIEIDFTFGQGIPLRIRINDAVQVESIKPSTDFLQIELNGEQKVVQIRATIFPNVPPRVPYNSRLSYGLEVGGIWQKANAQGNIVTEHMTLNTMTGQLTAIKSTLRATSDYVVVVYSQDSIKSLEQQDIEVGTNPKKYARLTVSILDNKAQEYVISNKQQFLAAFYSGKSKMNSTDTFETWRSRTDTDYENYFFQIAADIDLTGEHLEPLHVFNGHIMGSYTYTMTGGRKLAQYSVSGMQFSQPHVATDSASHINGKIARYGFISMLGEYGVVEGINFRMVHSYVQIDSNVDSATSAAFGVVAAINYGKISDVGVFVSKQRSLSVIVTNLGPVTQLHVGGLVGLNYGVIKEDVVSVYATGDIVVSVARDIAINAGGLVGSNFGTLKGKEAASILEENVLTNSDMVVAIAQAGSQAGEYNAGGIAGYNVGEIIEISSEAAVYNSARGNTGGLVGRNHWDISVSLPAGVQRARIAGCYSNGAIYAQGAIGGLVGRNSGGTITQCYYDFFVNTKVKDSLAAVIAGYAPTGASSWLVKNFYAGIVVTGEGMYTPAGGKSDYDTVVGGVVGINTGGSLYSCFASSAFDKDTGAYDSVTRKYGEIMGLRFMGDIFINEARDVVVGGLIGRQTGTSASVTRSYSNLSIYYQAKAGDSPRDHVIAGLVGEVVSGTTITFDFCYSNITLSLEGNIGGVRIGGLLGTNSGNCTFKLCYSMVDESSIRVQMSAALYKLAVATTGVTTFQSVRYLNANNTDIPVASNTLPTTLADFRALNLASTSATYGWAYNTQTASQGFMNCASTAAGSADRKALECKAGLTNDHTKCIGGGLPMIRYSQSGADKPLFIAKPETIKLFLRTHDDRGGEKGYTSIPRFNARNDRGGFNFVIPQTNFFGEPVMLTDASGRPDNKPDKFYSKAALLFSSGDYYASSIVANRYYLDDLFTTAVSPDIAKQRIAARIGGAGSDTAEIGYDSRWVDNGDGTGQFEQSYYVDVKRVGYFELIIESTRDIHTPPSVAGYIKFDIVDGITYQSIFSNFVGTVGYQSLSAEESSNGMVFSHNFSVRKNQSFFFRASADRPEWNFIIFEGEGCIHKGSSSKLNCGCIGDDPWNAALVNNTLPNGRLFRYNDTGYAVFSFVPYLVSPTGGVYHALALEIRLRVQIYAGATELSLGQSINKIDGTSTTAFDGRIVTDVTFNTLETPAWDNNTAPEQKLLTLISFSFNDGKENRPLFGRSGYIADYSTTTRIPVRSNIAGNEQDFTLVFTLRIVNVERVDSYDVYTFKIMLGVEVDADALYKDKTQSHFETGVNAIKQGIKGTLLATERQYEKNNHGEPLRAKGDIEVYAQDLQTVEFQHYARTQKIGVDGLTLGEENINGEKASVGGEGQQQSMNIFTENGVGGLFKIYALPYFSNIDKFTMVTDTVYTNYILNAKGQVVGEEKWDLTFRQMIWDVQNKIYVNASTDAEAPFVQFSEKNGNYYNWTGVYYIQTNLRYLGGTPTMRVEEGTRFDITATFTTNGRTVTHKTALFALNMPGIYFDFDGEVNVNESSQAVGTLVPLRVYTVGSARFSDESGSVSSGDNYYKISVSRTDLQSKVKLIPDKVEENLFWLKIDPDFPFSGDIVNTIVITFYGTVMENGLRQSIDETLSITPVLYKLSGFRLVGIAGNNIRLINQNRQSAVLQAITTHYTREIAAKEFSGEVNEKLISLIKSEVARFNSLVNESEDVFWDGVVDGAYWQLNSRNSSANSEYYNRNTDKGLNFVLGKSNRTQERFIMAAVTEQRTNGLSIEVCYNYNNGLPVICATIDRTGSKSLTAYYNVITVRKSAMDNPFPIYKSNSWQLQWMTDPTAHYILMEDVEFDSWMPIKFEAASLDGNNKKITINSFALNPLPLEGQTNIGMFSEVSKGSMLKNINLVLPRLLTVNLTGYNFVEGTLAQNTVNVGALAGTNNGIITNCAVLTDSQVNGPEMGDRVDYNRSFFNSNSAATGTQVRGNAQSRFEVVSDSTQVTVRLGGLVGQNSATGVVSNSRVLVDVYMNGTSVENEEATGKVNVKTALVGGLVAVNSGYIVSSFFRDANVVNRAGVSTSIAGVQNLTAGLVASNTAEAVVSGCYVMGMSSNLNADGTVRAGEILANKEIGALVHENAGTIIDSYTNIIMVTTQPSAGMVYVNAATGVIRNCFALNQTTVSYSYNGFTSVKAGKIENNRYVNSGRSQDLLPEQARELYLSGPNTMKDINNFGGFSMANTGDPEFGHSWRMTLNGPRLVSANDIAVSIRELSAPVGDSIEPVFYYVEGYNYGSARNPVLITDGAQFNKVFYEDTDASLQDKENETHQIPIDYDLNVYEGHLRLVNNISLKSVTVQSHKSTLRNGVFDGNGLKIENIIISVSLQELTLRSVGLFSRIEYSTVKNLNLHFDMAGSSSVAAGNVSYVGGLAGVALNSNVVNVHTMAPTDSTRPNAVIRGKNFVGGVIGVAIQFSPDGENNEFRIEHVSSSMNVYSAVSESATFPSYISAADYMTKDYDKLGVAGGVIGFITNNPLNDLGYLVRDTSGKAIEEDVGYSFDDTLTKVSYVSNNGNVAADVSGAITGGLIGVIGEEVIVTNAVYQPSVGSGSLRARFFVGGITGANFGRIDGSARVSDTVTPTAITELALRVVAPRDGATPVAENYITSQTFDGVYHERRGLTVGGIAGFNSGSILGTTDNPIVSAIKTTAASYRYMQAVGGIVGENRGGIVNGCTVLGDIRGGFVVGVVIGMNTGNGASVEGNKLGNYVFTNILKEQGKGAEGPTDIEALFLTGQGKTFGDNLFKDAEKKRVGITGGIIGYNEEEGLTELDVKAANPSVNATVNIFGTLSSGR